jgi:hypothetical protein
MEASFGFFMGESGQRGRALPLSPAAVMAREKCEASPRFSVKPLDQEYRANREKAKPQAPTSPHQRSPKFQISPECRFESAAAERRVNQPGYRERRWPDRGCCLKFLWSLELGAWCACADLRRVIGLRKNMMMCHHHENMKIMGFYGRKFIAAPVGTGSAKIPFNRLMRAGERPVPRAATEALKTSSQCQATVTEMLISLAA